MTKSNLDTETIRSELTGKSSFFESPSSKKTSDSSKTKKGGSVRGVRPVREGRDVRPVRPSDKREVKRHPFNIYRDQLDSLKHLKSKHMMETGEERSMAMMVREALDTFIRKHKSSTPRTGRT